MEDVQNPRKRLSRQSLTAYSILSICIVLLATLLLSPPPSTTHADSSIPAWDGNFIAYQVGTQVTYDGNTYTCIQSHTSEPNWTPNITADLWQLDSGASQNPSNVSFSVSTATPTPDVTPTATSAPLPAASTPTDTATPGVTPTATPATGSQQSQSGMTSVSVTFYTDEGTMADGQQTHIGACAVYIPQYPLGTEMSLYNPDNFSQPAYTCTAEDTGTHICQNNIDVALPGQVSEAIQLGVQEMELKVTGFNSQVAQDAAANHYSSVGCELGSTH
jgi:3D (Asp-Asp-Asp) domain-containing protein